MPDPIIQVKNLSKTYRVPVRPEGIKAAFNSILKPQHDDVDAVQNVSFQVQEGEVIGLIGPNGAGKTTTLKMLSGLLHPSSGQATVSGYIPWKREHAYLRKISLVMGNKSQMLWDIPPMDSFRVLAEIYGVNAISFKRSIDELVQLLEMEELLSKPVRNLSLGERMKCELTASLLHHPSVLFLDEPTLGLDVSMQLRLRRFLKEYNQLNGVTIILTSHYMADVEALCPRVLLIHRGKLLHDGPLTDLARKMVPYKMLKITLNQESIADGIENLLPTNVELMERVENQLTLRAPHFESAKITAQLLQTLPIADLTVEDPPIELVIDQIYSGGEL